MTEDLIFTKKYLKVILKWSKTIQNRDRIAFPTLPQLKGSPLCPFAACRAAIRLYQPYSDDPLFQIKVGST